MSATMFHEYEDYMKTFYTFDSTIPRAIVAVKLGVTVLFVLVNVAFIAVLGPKDIRESSAVAMVPGDPLINTVFTLNPVSL